MTEDTTPPETLSDQLPDKAERRAIYETMTLEHGIGGGQLLPKTFNELLALANLMAMSDIAVPPHLRGNKGACFAVAMQAVRWGMDPFAVSQKTYLVASAKNPDPKLAYEAQLIAAVVNTRANLAKRPEIKFSGEGNSMVCTVTFTFQNGDVREYDSPEFAKIQPKNSPLWTSDPKSQLSYYSLRAAARRWVPEVLLGVYDRDEIEGAEPMRDITPVGQVSERNKPNLLAKLKGGGDGFSAEHVEREMNGGGTTMRLIDSQPGESIPMTSASLEREMEPVRTGSSISGEAVGAVRADAKGLGDKSRRKAKPAGKADPEPTNEATEVNAVTDELYSMEGATTLPSDADELEALHKAMGDMQAEKGVRNRWHTEFEGRFSGRPEAVNKSAEQIVTAHMSRLKADNPLSLEECNELCGKAINRHVQDTDLFQPGESK